MLQINILKEDGEISFKVNDDDRIGIFKIFPDELVNNSLEQLFTLIQEKCERVKMAAARGRMLGMPMQQAPEQPVEQEGPAKEVKMGWAGGAQLG